MPASALGADKQPKHDRRSERAQNLSDAVGPTCAPSYLATVGTQMPHQGFGKGRTTASSSACGRDRGGSRGGASGSMTAIWWCTAMSVAVCQAAREPAKRIRSRAERSAMATSSACIQGRHGRNCVLDHVAQWFHAHSKQHVGEREPVGHSTACEACRLDILSAGNVNPQFPTVASSALC